MTRSSPASSSSWSAMDRNGIRSHVRQSSRRKKIQERQIMRFSVSYWTGLSLAVLVYPGGPLIAQGQPNRRPAGGGSARSIVEQAAEALGGAARVRAVRNITLTGYGQYAYMFGGGRITGSPDAPEKYIAANDLRRVYDLEHGRFQQLERRNMLFPFLAAFGHSFALNNLVLDGDLAFDVNGDRPVRIARWIESPLYVDGVHMRRMWMLNNPIALVRA